MVRKLDSSMAESPPPTTARGLSRKIGAGPSQTAQAEMPWFQYASDPGKLRRRATAPVATITASARRTVVALSETTRKGRAEKSTAATVSGASEDPSEEGCEVRVEIGERRDPEG